MKKKLDIDTFGNAVDNALKESNVSLLVQLPPGTLDAKIIDNVGAGSVVNLYIIMHGLKAVLKDLTDHVESLDDKEGFLDECLKMIKNDIMEGE